MCAFSQKKTTKRRGNSHKYLEDPGIMFPAKDCLTPKFVKGNARFNPEHSPPEIH